MSTKKRLAEQAVREHTSVEAAVRGCEAAYDALLRTVDSMCSQAASAAEREYSAAMQRATGAQQRAMGATVSALQKITSSGDVAIVPWGHVSWQRHEPPAQGLPPAFVRIGELRPQQLQTNLPPVPALVPLVGQKHLLVACNDAESRIANALLQSIAWRVAALSPPGSYRFALFDLLDRGNNLSSLLALPEGVRGDHIHCQDDDVEKALRQITQEIEEINQKRLGHTHAGIDAYNEANPSLRVPYRFVVFIGFPKGFSAKAADLLSSIARTGPRTGCYLLGAFLPGAKMPYDFDLPSFTQSATLLTVRSADVLEWKDAEFPLTTVRPDPPPPTMLVDRLGHLIDQRLQTSVVDDIPFRSIALPPAQWWHQSSAGGLSVDIGMSQTGEPYTFEIGKELVHHALVGGTTGSGKSTALHVLIMTLCTRYSPEELELYLVDFKDGVEFQDYATYKLPHARAVVLEAEREFGLSVIQRLEAEMERRAQLFKEAHVPSLVEYRRQLPGEHLPRILLLIDEYVALFTPGDALADKAAASLGALVMRGRSYGIHVLLSAQRPGSSFLDRGNIKNLMELRVALKSRPDDSALILGEGNTRAATLTERGEAYITTNPDNPASAEKVRIALLTPQERAAYLNRIAQIHAFHLSRQHMHAQPTIVFSRSAPVLWAESAEVAPYLADPHGPAARVPTAWLGQPIKIAADVAVEFDAEPRANLLIVGANEELAARLLIAALLGIGLSAPAPSAEILYIGAADGQKPAGAIVSVLATSAVYRMTVVDRQPAVDALAAWHADLTERLDSPSAAGSGPRFLVVAGLHRWSQARSSSPIKLSPVGEQLLQFWRQGPEAGIHTILWTDRLSGLAGAVGQGALQDSLSQFGRRVVMQTTADESTNLLYAPDALKLGDERAFYRDERLAGEVRDKFKPYALPQPVDVTRALDAIRAGGVARAGVA